MADIWIVVQFLEEDSVEAVPDSWINTQQNVCSWPPKSLKYRINDLIRKKAFPEESWVKFAVKVLGFYEKYETVKRKALKAQDTSELSSTDELKRKKKHNLKYISDTDESEEEIRNARKRRPKKKFDFPKLPERLDWDKNDEETNYSKRDVSSHIFCGQSSQIERVTTPTTPSYTKQTCNCSNQEFQRQVLSKLNILCAQMSSHGEMLQILAKFLPQNKKEDLQEYSVMKPIIELFPIKSDEDLGNVESSLVGAQNILLLAKELSLIGGDSVKEISKRIMYRIFSNEMGKLYSWDGAKGKRPFKMLALAQVIIKAVRLNKRTDSTAEDEIVKGIKSWLLRAKDRHENILKKLPVDYEREAAAVLNVLN